VRLNCLSHVAANLIAIGFLPLNLVHYLSGGHDQDSVGKIQDLVEILTYQKYRSTPIPGRQQLPADLGRSGGIEAEAWILRNEEPNVLRKFAGLDNALHIAAGQILDSRNRRCSP
jgi:hypothetical protein